LFSGYFNLFLDNSHTNIAKNGKARWSGLEICRRRFYGPVARLYFNFRGGISTFGRRRFLSNFVKKRLLAAGWRDSIRRKQASGRG